jgi:hypothetical protein
LFNSKKVKDMEKTVAAWYKGSLALYKVSGGNEGVFNAELVKFDGPSEAGPPKEFSLHKEGRHWQDDDINQDLLDELGKAIEIQVFGTEQSGNPRNYHSGRPR